MFLNGILKCVILVGNVEILLPVVRLALCSSVFIYNQFHFMNTKLHNSVLIYKTRTFVTFQSLTYGVLLIYVFINFEKQLIKKQNTCVGYHGFRFYDSLLNFLKKTMQLFFISHLFFRL